ncbi:hypothetical protein N7451_012880 [Penicillium sp. IBT 35674x]|nr:hypothetical protein N7451_012880 [Penicillium sp. IBT 35674x]
MATRADNVVTYYAPRLVIPEFWPIVTLTTEVAKWFLFTDFPLICARVDDLKMAFIVMRIIAGELSPHN